MNKSIVHIVIILAVVIGIIFGLLSKPFGTKTEGSTIETVIETTINQTQESQEVEVGVTEGIEENTGILASDAYKGKLIEEGTKNILIIGEDTENQLYDTIGVINIDKANKKIKIIMIPRDMYVEYSDTIKDFLTRQGKINEPGYMKINNAHHIGFDMGFEGKFSWKSMSFLNQIFIEKFGIEFDDFIKIDKYAVRNLVNVFGGVVVNVPYTMNYDDIYQDLSIHLEKGEQLLNGEQAEGFVRFRQGLDAEGNMISYGDVERKENQIKFMKAFIKQHGTLSNITKLPQILSSFKDNVKHSIGFGDLLTTYLKLANDVINDSYTIESTVLEGEIETITGSSYLLIN